MGGVTADGLEFGNRVTGLAMARHTVDGLEQWRPSIAANIGGSKALQK